MGPQLTVQKLTCYKNIHSSKSRVKTKILKRWKISNRKCEKRKKKKQKTKRKINA